MPATIIGNNEWNQRGLVLTAQDAQEQVNGLVNVQATYVGPSSKHDIISRSFYQDAPPPIWPDVVNRSELVTNRLYMESRTVTRANGLTTVRASYVGGLQRAGFKGYFLREVVEPNKSGMAYWPSGGGIRGIVGIQFVDDEPLFILGAAAIVVWNERIKLIEVVRVGNNQAARLPTFYWPDLGSATYNADAWEYNALVASRGPAPVLQTSLTYYLRTVPLSPTESSNYITPTVQVVTYKYALSS
jgi:hypothetical protein